ncbi:agmatine deiminase family protein [Nitratireductor sp. XY-223]|uniref:agmatine deiminase family protein n=1 Tax=Nitratireductor sp. XY-223 TaxID=2561926 RepID=UPI0010AAA902|nr:agmatine deiminase family protein [Nitratireductor sp. XY-223]
MTRREFLGSTAAVTFAPAAFASGGGADGDSTERASFYMPEESLPHLRTFMQWPASRTVHPDRQFLRILQETIADIANTVAEFEPVVMLMPQASEEAARRLLAGTVEIWPIPTEDLWCRDSGPVFVTDGSGDLAISQLNFNGWGNKQVHANDGLVAQRVAERLGLRVIDSGVVGEGGGVETDGEGTLLAHESSWVNPNRNDLPKHEIERRLLGALGADKMIWAPGIAGADITDYHIDSLARFTAPGKVLIQLPQAVDPEDPWSAAAFETYDILRAATDMSGQPLEVAVVPEPVGIRVEDDEFVASYVNYYVCNGAVIAAEFGDSETDSEAERLLKELYPGREIVSLNVDPVGEMGGGIHCATQQQPLV